MKRYIEAWRALDDEFCEEFDVSHKDSIQDFLIGFVTLLVLGVSAVLWIVAWVP